MKELLKDLKELRKSNAQKDLQAEMGYSYEDMYDTGYLTYLKNLCDKYQDRAYRWTLPLPSRQALP